MLFISYGQIDRKLYFVAIIIIIEIVKNILYNELMFEYINDLLIFFLEEIGTILAGIIMLFILKQKQKKIKAKKKFSNIIILFLLRLAKSSYDIIYVHVVLETHYNYDLIINTTNGFQILLMTLWTFVLLKYKYYIHHIISMIIYCTLGIASDFILGNFTILKYNYIIFHILNIIVEAFLMCYIKYMMDKCYYDYTETLIYYGLIGLITNFCIFAGIAVYEYANGINTVIKILSDYFAETNVIYIIFYLFLYTLLYSAILNLLKILMIFYLRPNHLVITDEIIVYFNIIIYEIIYL